MIVIEPLSAETILALFASCCVCFQCGKLLVITFSPELFFTGIYYLLKAGRHLYGID